MRCWVGIIAVFGLSGILLSVAAGENLYEVGGFQISSPDPPASSFKEPRRVEHQFFSPGGGTQGTGATLLQSEAGQPTPKAGGPAEPQPLTRYRRDRHPETAAGTAAPGGSDAAEGSAKHAGTLPLRFLGEEDSGGTPMGRLHAESAPLSAIQPRSQRDARNPGIFKELPDDTTAAGHALPTARHGDRSQAASQIEHAEYEQPEDSPKRGTILPVRASDENVTPFAPVGSAGERSATVAPEGKSPASAGTAETRTTPELPHHAEAQSGGPSRVTVSVPDSPATADVDATGPQTPTVTLHWIKPAGINVGQECACRLNVANSGETVVHDVNVVAYFPSSVRLTSADPQPEESQDHLSWDVGTLQPGEEQVMRIRMIPSRRGELKTTAFVRFSGAAAGLFDVKEPLIELDVQGAEKVLIGDPASQTIRVSNPGTGVATNVTLEARIPEGLEHLRGERLAMEIGSLNPGETRVVRLAMAAVGPGPQKLDLQVTADGGIRQAVAETIEVVSASLSASLRGPGVGHVERSGRYVLTVTNDGEAPSNNVRAVYQIPDGFEFVRAEKGGRHDAVRKSVGWFVGRLEPGQSTELAVDLTAVETGSFEHRAAVSSEHGVGSNARLATQVKGTAALALEIIERDDPVRLGEEAAYQIRVRNDGSEAARNVSLSVELPAGVRYLKAHGPSDHLAENGLLLFKSFDRLDTGKTAVYQFHVRATSPGNHRFRVRLVSDSIIEPIVAEETTKFYSE